MSIVAVYDVFCTILQYCDNQTLARLARVSKLTSDPALDVLWETLESFAYLLRLLPPDVIAWNHHHKLNTPVIKHLLLPRDWKRFTPYARRVKKWEKEDLSYISETLVDHVAFGRLPDYILPNLTDMTVQGPIVAGIHLQTLLISPSLKTVRVINPQPYSDATHAMQSFFRTLSDRVPDLETLTVQWGESESVDDSFRDALLDVYHGLHGLRELFLWSSGCISATALSALATLPHLKVLYLNLRDGIDFVDWQVMSSSIKDPFPALKNITLEGRVDSFHTILNYFGEGQLTHISFQAQEYPQALALQKLFDAVFNISATSLSSIRFSVPKGGSDRITATRQYMFAQELYNYSSSALQPLLSMSKLEVVDLEFGLPFLLSDEELSLIGSVWPNIEILNLCTDPYCERTRGMRPSATIKGLLQVVKSCPRLSHLGLYIDWGMLLGESLLIACPQIPNDITHLEVGRSWIAEPAMVAALISGIFPLLQVFSWAGMEDPDSWRESSTGHSPAWRQVFDLLPVFRATRANERAHLDPIKAGKLIEG